MDNAGVGARVQVYDGRAGEAAARGASLISNITLRSSAIKFYRATQAA